MSKASKTFNILLLLLSMAVTILMCCLTTPEDTTISAMQVRQPVLGVLWAVATSLAVYFNMNYLRKKHGVENKCFQIFIIIGSVAALLTPFTMSESPIGFSLPFINIHRLSALVFAVVTYVSMITILIARRKEHTVLYPVFSAALLAVGLVNVYGMFALSSFISALMETCLIIVGLTVLFLANFVVPAAPCKQSEEPRKPFRRLALSAVCVAVLVIMVCGVTTIPSYRVTVSDTVIAERTIPGAGYTEVTSEYFSIYLPDTWQERKYNDRVLYYDDVDRNSISVVYENKKNLDNMPKFSLIQNANIKSSELIQYMGQTMLVVKREDNGAPSYTYQFNSDEKTVSITLSFTDSQADRHEEIFRSLFILTAE